MGVGVSSLRLRKALVIRAYNLREEDETLDEQFRKLCYYSNLEENGSGNGSRDGRDSGSESGSGKGELTLNLDDVKEYLGFNSGSGSTTFDRLLGGTLLGQRIPFKAFVDFLDTGSMPSMGLLIPDPSAVDENVENMCLSSDAGATSGPSSVSNGSRAQSPRRKLSPSAGSAQCAAAGLPARLGATS